MGENTNGRVLNLVALIYLALLLVASIAAIPLMIWTRAGQ
jgi:manganese transport protein